jgi:hypothetical protein
MVPADHILFLVPTQQIQVTAMAPTCQRGIDVLAPLSGGEAKQNDSEKGQQGGFAGFVLAEEDIQARRQSGNIQIMKDAEAVNM